MNIYDLMRSNIQVEQPNSVFNDNDALRSEVRYKSQVMDERFLEMCEKVDKLSLVCQALWEILRDKAALDENEISQKITEIDLRDGKEDGKITPTPKKCPECDSMICAKFSRCLFCGYEDTDSQHLF